MTSTAENSQHSALRSQGRPPGPPSRCRRQAGQFIGKVASSADNGTGVRCQRSSELPRPGERAPVAVCRWSGPPLTGGSRMTRYYANFAHPARPARSGSPGSSLCARRRLPPVAGRHSRSNGVPTRATSVTPGTDAREMATEQHQMRRVQLGDRSARVDLVLADLIELCWKAGISTDFSCQDSRPEGSPRRDLWSYISFSDADDLRALLDAFDGTPLAKLRCTTRFDTDPASLTISARAATWEAAVYVRPGPAGTCELTGRIGFPPIRSRRWRPPSLADATLTPSRNRQRLAMTTQPLRTTLPWSRLELVGTRLQGCCRRPAHCW